jgi:hypothetical protein
MIRSDKKGNKKKGPQCYKCKEWGHKRVECPKLMKDSGTASAMIARQDDLDSDGDVLTVSSEKSCEEAWLLDSASSFHVTPRKEWFLSYGEKEGDLVHLVDDSAYHIIVVGNIKFKMCDGQEILFKGVKHVPGLRTNLISLAILHEEGWMYHAMPDKKTLRVMHGGKTIMVGEKSCAHQYMLKGSVVGGGVMDGNASMAVFYPMVGEVVAASSGYSK